MQQVRGSLTVECLDEILVPRLAKEGKRCEQGTHADTGHDLELRSITATTKAHQCSGTKCAPGAAARERKDIERAAAGRRTDPPLDFFRMSDKKIAVNA